MQNFIKKIITLLIKKKIKYHDVSKFLNTNDLFFDVGAHLGEKSKELIKNNINVVMIEPQPKCLKQLNKLYSENKFVTIVPMGLGKSQQKMEMSINSKQPVTSTFAEHWKTGRFLDSTWDEKIEVDITTLDELIKKFGSPKYIKIDVVGLMDPWALCIGPYGPIGPIGMGPLPKRPPRRPPNGFSSRRCSRNSSE